jgi:hypothetical protein
MTTHTSLDQLAEPEDRNARLSDLLRTTWSDFDIVEIYRLPHEKFPDRPDSGWLVLRN